MWSGRRRGLPTTTVLKYRTRSCNIYVNPRFVISHVFAKPGDRRPVTFILPSPCYLCTYRCPAFVRDNSTSEPTPAVDFLIFSCVLLRGERWRSGGSNIIAGG